MELEWYPSRHNLILRKPDHKVANSHRRNVWNIFPFKPSFKSNHGQRKQSSIKAPISWYLTIFASHQNIIHKTTSFLPINKNKQIKPHTQRKLISYQNSFLKWDIKLCVINFSTKSMKIRNTIKSFYFILFSTLHH